jgi:CheY-like chemotaxis protein
MLREELEHHVELADDRENGIDLLKRLADFDLVITNIKIPNKDGNEVARHISTSHGSNIPVIAITAFPEEADAALFDYRIIKPSNLENHRAAIARFTNCGSAEKVSFLQRS